ncbi:MAG: glycosyltransferase, partial [Chloroflexota bacterium]|nr:glycosyltransferase [Chloroflexota bacterium]
SWAFSSASPLPGPHARRRTIDGRPAGGLLTPDCQPAILCLAHLGWDRVWQRPQQLLSRLARHYPVHYVAEPEITSSREGTPHLKLVAEDRHLRAWQPVFPDRADVIERWRETYWWLVRDLLLREGWAESSAGTLTATRPLVAWFYTPTPWYLLDQLPAHLVVYDVMDDLTSFKGAAADLPWRESQLLAEADLVFAGGRSLYAARKDRHPGVHLFPSGVDAAHFARALDPRTEVPPEIADLPRPVLGYYGVIDERIDLDLLGALARRCPAWSFVLVGPLAKREPAHLPCAPNLHYVGQQPYARLPAFLKGFDVCLMPFALNDATRSISPTKALEYMAARKPIVSTPVPDVVAHWSEAVMVAPGTDGFEDVIVAALAETEAPRVEREACQAHMVGHNGWEHIAEEMRGLIDAALGMEPRAPAGHAPVGSRRVETLMLGPLTPDGSPD